MAERISQGNILRSIGPGLKISCALTVVKCLKSIKTADLCSTIIKDNPNLRTLWFNPVYTELRAILERLKKLLSGGERHPVFVQPAPVRELTDKTNFLA